MMSIQVRECIPTPEMAVRTVGKSAQVLGREEIMKYLSAIASADISDFIGIKDNSAYIKDLDDIPEYARLAVAGIKNSAGGRGAEIHFYDRMKALDMLCKCQGIYSPDSDDSDIMDKLDEVLDAVGE